MTGCPHRDVARKPPPLPACACRSGVRCGSGAREQDARRGHFRRSAGNVPRGWAFWVLLVYPSGIRGFVRGAIFLPWVCFRAGRMRRNGCRALGVGWIPGAANGAIRWVCILMTCILFLHCMAILARGEVLPAAVIGMAVLPPTMHTPLQVCASCTLQRT